MKELRGYVTDLLIIVHSSNTYNIREGVVLVKQRSAYKCRKQIEKPEQWAEVYRQYVNRQITARKAKEILEIKRNVFYNFIKQEKAV